MLQMQNATLDLMRRLIHTSLIMFSGLTFSRGSLPSYVPVCLTLQWMRKAMLHIDA